MSLALAHQQPHVKTDPRAVLLLYTLVLVLVGEPGLLVIFNHLCFRCSGCTSLERLLAAVAG